MLAQAHIITTMPACSTELLMVTDSCLTNNALICYTHSLKFLSKKDRVWEDALRVAVDHDIMEIVSVKQVKTVF
jgi:hypothetical protein